MVGGTLSFIWHGVLQTMRWMGARAAQELIYNLRLPLFQAQQSHQSHVESVTAKSATPPAALGALWLYCFRCTPQLKSNPELTAIHHHAVGITRRQTRRVNRGKAKWWQQYSSLIFFFFGIVICLAVTRWKCISTVNLFENKRKQIQFDDYPSAKSLDFH